MRIGLHSRGWRLGVLAVALTAFAAGASSGGGGDDWGAVYTLTNDPDGNELAVYARDGRGRLAAAEFVPTGGNGTGGGFGNQGALALSDDNRFLYAVNPGSDTITVFRLARRGPQVLQVIAAGGRRPISLTVHKDLLYVLNAGGAVNGVDEIAGFEVLPNGRLRPLPGSGQRLSAANTAPAQVGFNRAGTALVVTEKSTNLIAVFGVDRRGLPDGRAFAPSSGQTPFGFEFSRDGFLIVSEAFGGAANASAVSSYWLNAAAGTLKVISPSVPTTKSAACWIAITRDGEYAYTTNTAGDTVTGYKIAKKGTLTRLDDDGVTAETGTAPTDMAVLGNRTLFVLNRDDATVGVYEINEGGALAPVQLVGGLPPHPSDWTRGSVAARIGSRVASVGRDPAVGPHLDSRAGEDANATRRRGSPDADRPRRIPEVSGSHPNGRSSHATVIGPGVLGGGVCGRVPDHGGADGRA